MKEIKEYSNLEEIKNTKKKHAEFITGQELRRYVAEKIKKYVPNLETVFDGAIGSGQLEQYLDAKKVYGVEIQEKSAEVCRENYPGSDIENKSFFLYDRDDVVCDAVIMNPPFSLPFKELSKEEQEAIKKEFTWKKSGLLDDIFTLKSLKHTKRYGFYILFPGVCYRKPELKFRELVGNKLLELNMIENAFEDTKISVIFIVIDKEKQDNSVYKEVYNCKSEKILKSETTELEEDFRWQQPIVEKEVEVIDIDDVNKKLVTAAFMRLRDFIKSQYEIIVFMEDERYKQDCLNHFEVMIRMLKEAQRLYKGQVNNFSKYEDIKPYWNIYNGEMEKKQFEYIRQKLFDFG